MECHGQIRTPYRCCKKYNDSEIMARTEYSGTFKEVASRGVKHACRLSPTLYNISKLCKRIEAEAGNAEY